MLRLFSASNRLVQVIKRRSTVFRIELANKWNYFVNSVAGYESSGESLERSKAGGEIL
jgi:hypothetical protein